MQTDLEKYCSLAVDLYKELHKIPELGGVRNIKPPNLLKIRFRGGGLRI